MKSILLITILLSANAFAATGKTKQFKFNCAITYPNGKTNSFSGDLSQKKRSYWPTSELRLDKVLTYSGTDIKALTCSDEQVGGDYQGAPYTNCSHELKKSVDSMTDELNIRLPGFDMLDLALNAGLPLPKVDFKTKLTVIGPARAGFADHIGHNQGIKVIGNVNCVITKK